jgi:RNA polymerase sigma-70 factor (ECF subfamily)
MMGPESFGCLVDRHAAALVLYARQWCTTPEDVVQDAFLKLYRCRTPPENIVPWLYRVVRNASISASRGARRRLHHERVAADRTPAWFIPRTDDALDASVAAAALERLAVEEREVVVARIWGGLTFEQIAAVTGTSSSSAHRLYVAGLTALRERLKVACPQKANTLS